MNAFSEKVIYQIYPKSFQDSNGDGIGDLNGIRSRLPYLQELGVNMLWLNPIYPSPQRDNGYDVSDYKAIDPVFGSMEEFEQLVEEAGTAGMEIMMDMVFNHTSTAHPWFQKALAGEEKYKDFYIIREAKEDGSLPTNWPSKFGGPAWEPFGNTGCYYLHLYDVSQADLNWRNPEVRKELADVVNFWLEKGVKGFRFDVINVIGKDEILLDAEDGVGKSLYTDRPIVHEYIREMNHRTFGKKEGTLTVGEMSSTDIQNGVLYSAKEREELSMIFSFHHLKVDYKDGDKWTNTPFDFMQLKNILSEWQEGMEKGGGWNALFWNNHDQPRANNRFGDPENYPFETATLLAQTIHLLRGTPFIYQGEEIGMVDPDFEELKEYRDIESLNAYQELTTKGKTEEQALALVKKKSRDNSRTPMQWSKELHAGFTTGTPWINAGDSYQERNTTDSPISQRVYAYYQQLIRLRKELTVISKGSYKEIEPNHPEVYSYIRETEQEELLVLNHFYGEKTTVRIPKRFCKKNIIWVIGNRKERSVAEEFELEAYETVALLRNKQS